MRKTVTRQVPRVAVLDGPVDSESESDSELDDLNDMIIDDPERPVSRVHPHRVRFWGLAASPGDGCTAVVVSKHLTQHSDRRGRSRVLFSWQDDEDAQELVNPSKLTTEGRVWESMYGRLKGMADIRADSIQPNANPLRALFKSVVPNQKCVFCSSPLVTFSTEATCEKGHSFGTSSGTLFFPRANEYSYVYCDWTGYLGTRRVTGLLRLRPSMLECIGVTEDCR